MLWVLIAVVSGLLVVGVIFDLLARRRGSYRAHAYYEEASRQRRAQRVNLLHTFYDRRAGQRDLRGPRHGRR